MKKNENEWIINAKEIYIEDEINENINLWEKEIRFNHRKNLYSKIGTG